MEVTVIWICFPLLFAGVARPTLEIYARFQPMAVQHRIQAPTLISLPLSSSLTIETLPFP